jgi:hypothetical protein
LPIGLHDQHVTVVEPGIQFPKAVGSGLALDLQQIVTKRQLEVVAGLVSAADFPGAYELGYGKLYASALPARTEPAHGVASLANSATTAITFSVSVISAGITFTISVANAGSVRLYVRVAPLWQRIAASFDINSITGRPRSSQTSPV